MRKLILSLLAVIILSCTSSKEIPTKQEYSEYEIVNTQLIVVSDTIYLNELRFYKIHSALDGMKIRYQNYGEWNKKIEGKHQQNMNRIIWENVKLIDNNDTTFTVIADGTETKTNYFACLMVFDSAGNDCFKAEHPYKETLTELLTNKMKDNDQNSRFYKLFK
ncbi:MAG: hypothetical protein ABI295_08660 [Xanthomarina sp.]